MNLTTTSVTIILLHHNSTKVTATWKHTRLGLGLSLNFPHTYNNQSSSHFQLNLMPSLLPTSAAASPSGVLPQKPLWNDPLPSSDLNSNSERCRGGPRSFLRGIDVNQLPPTGDYEEEAGVSSPNSTVSTVSGKRSERDTNGEDLDLERDFSRGLSDKEDCETSKNNLGNQTVDSIPIERENQNREAFDTN